MTEEKSNENKEPVAAEPVMPKAESDARLWGMLTHLSALVAFLGIPFGNVLGPLIVWQVKKNQIPSVEKHGKEALNFQISICIYGLVASILIFILIGFPLLIGLILADVVLTIIAGVKVNNGEDYQYPFTIRFIK